MGWGHGWGGGNWLAMIFGMLFMVLFWGGLITLVFFLVRTLVRSSSGASHSTDSETGPRRRALEILKERYARGELTRDEYEQMREDLQR